MRLSVQKSTNGLHPSYGKTIFFLLKKQLQLRQRYSCTQAEGGRMINAATKGQFPAVWPFKRNNINIVLRLALQK